MRKKYYIETYGCQMNVADSELVAGLLQKEGFGATTQINEADAIFVNTCAVREHAEERVHSRLGNFRILKEKKPELIVGVLGCMAQNLKNKLLENKPYIDVVLGPDSYRKLPELINRKLDRSDSVVDTKLSRFEVYDDLFPSRQTGINAWVSIMRGCDKFCTFCIVPFTRGRERSRPVDSIVTEARQAVAEGFVELTLLGQNVNSYRHEEQGFADLLKAVAQVAGLKRIRYTSPHPQDIDDELLETMAELDNVCNSIHLPLQAGADRILQRMNRTYTRDHFMRLSDRIREILPQVGLTTDIIVGFPGETDEEFQQTLQVLEHVKFESAYTFKYSPRPGTKAAQFTDQVDPEKSQYRLEQLIKLQKQHTLIRNQENVGNTEIVLVEKESKRSSLNWAGRTDSNKWVIFDKGNAQIKDFVAVEITEARGVSLHGKITGVDQ
ncbi:MAG: tRNA (N6-isopentenyl adenosine(37)-C2)-methylthiotransferase MiaB [Candidatus Marinimicrobia bacterium]|nr:tRNA (N6-isopentenyl adenosine(37)-C2)-methylthiotransferase MiaB [Candidatus Neomarinimicrobiota bacterium]